MFCGFHGYNEANKKIVQYRMGMIACACEHYYTVNLTPLKFFTILYIQPLLSMACMQYS